MSRLKSELSSKNDDRISKHRYYELQHHCFQYSEWRRAAADLLTNNPDYLAEKYGKTNDISDPVAFAAQKREYYLKKIDRIKNICELVGGDSAYYLLACVTGGYSYDTLVANYGVLPCSRVEFYKRYRKFFKVLDTEV